MEVVGSLDVLPAANPAHDQMAAAQLAALRRLLVAQALAHRPVLR
jgi:hypothetical protein